MAGEIFDIANIVFFFIVKTFYIKKAEVELIQLIGWFFPNYWYIKLESDIFFLRS